ncbi:AMP-binding protein, partial [Methylocucumis oryzae]
MSVLGRIETLPELSAYQAKQRGDATAFVFEQRTLSYRELDKQANQIANGLLAEGMMPEARIAMLSKDSDNGYALLFGSAKARTVLIGINWRLAAQEILYILNQGQAELLFVSAEFFGIIEQIRAELTSVKKIIALEGQHAEWVSWLDWREQHYTSTPGLAYSPDDIVVQMYTSGTTGHPKGVQIPNHSFFRLMAGMRAQGDNWMGLTENDSLLVALPQFHMGGIWWAIQGVIAGATNVLMATFIAWQALELIAKHRITLVEMVPSMLQTALDEPGVTTTDLSSVRGFLYGGSPIAPALFRRALQIFNCDFYQIYGMTETGNMAV